MDKVTIIDPKESPILVARPEAPPPENIWDEELRAIDKERGRRLFQMIEADPLT